MKKTRKAKISIPVLLLLMLSTAAMPVIALGPEQAAEVGNNPNLSTSNGNPVLDTPSGVHNLWAESSGIFNHWITASKGEGKMNEAAIINTAESLAYLLTHLSEFENRWIYFDQRRFTAFLVIAQGMSLPDAMNIASVYPDGIYWHFVYVG